MKRLLLLAITALTGLGAAEVRAQDIISLAGTWEFCMGDTTSGWDDYVTLPGSMLTNGKGLPVSVQTQWTGSLYDSSFFFNPYMEKYRAQDNIKFPFFLTPERHYVGRAWYRRSIYVPETWRGRHIELFLERPHIETTVWVNGREAGHDMSLSTPHRYDMGRLLQPGRRNVITVCVYNGTENVCVGQDSHSVSDQTQGNWNGIVGRLELQARPKKVRIRNVRVYPDLTRQKAHVVVDLKNSANWGMGDVHVMQVREYGLDYDVTVDGQTEPLVSGYWTELNGREQVEFDIMMTGSMQAWDEFSPAVYRLTVYSGQDTFTTTFGFRDIGIDGRQMTINGRPLFIRGTVESCCFPQTGYPPTDEADWTDVFRKCKEWGINMVRFHSYCPPEAAFTAADHVGIYLQPEGPSWPNHGVALRRGMSIDDYLLDESRRIIDTYGNHPSFVMMAAGNEPAGDWVSYCDDWVAQMLDYDSTKVYCGASVGGGWAWDGGSEYHVKGGARGLDWDRHAPSSDDDYLAQIERPRNYRDSLPNQSPIIAHEQGQWCAFPDLSETSQYTGAYRARNFELFADLLSRGGMASQARKFLMASGRLQTLCYKYEMERNYRTPYYTGFQLLGLNDYSGQGTALVGPLNVFWREKGYVDARTWREFCSPLVVLARFPRFVFSSEDTLSVPVEMINAYRGHLSHSETTCQIWRNDTSLFWVDTLGTTTVLVGKNNQLGTIRLPLSDISEPSKLTLEVTVGNLVKNHWDFWVYPPLKAQAEAGDIYICDSLDRQAIDRLSRGGSVLLTAAGRVTLGSDVVQSYLPVFWNTSWFKMRPPHTTGAYIDTSHPLFRHGFPTDSWSNLNWWELLNRTQVMNLCELPSDYQPPIQPIDTWHVSRKLGMLIEARVLKGRLLMTTMDISSHLDTRLVARQMRQAIISYMQSDDFRPQIELTPQVIANFFVRQAPPVDMYTRESPDELKPKIF